MSSKVRIDLEFPIHASPSFLYQYISTPDSMGEWFADNVNSRGKKYIFIWDGAEEVAERIAQKNDTYIRFKWEEDDDDDSYFELRIEVDDLTKDVSLLVVDFADDDEVEESKMFWENQIAELKHVIGG
ncbi:START-like domain-containing protein [Lutimonas sp.]|uniref:START-like domain-containing protein n=1 Tax=Lutimonas sp. TaxID=1872403 RepID=UPI003D9BFB91